MKQDHRDYVSALATGLEVLSAFDAENREMTLSQVAEKLAIDRAKARRFLLTLVSLGYIEQNERLFSLSPKVLSLGHAYKSSHDYLQIVEHYLKKITKTIGESSSLGKMDGAYVVYVARSPSSQRLMSINITTGTRLPWIYTSMGRVLAAFSEDNKRFELLDSAELISHTDKSITVKSELETILDEVRSAGFCIVDQELEKGLRSIAVPVFSGKNELIGAMNVSANAFRVSVNDLKTKCLPLLMEAASSILQDTR